MTIEYDEKGKFYTDVVTKMPIAGCDTNHYSFGARFCTYSPGGALEE